MYCFTTDYEQKPYLIIENNIVTEVSEALLELTGFCQRDLQHQPFEDVWNQLLRVSIERDFIKERKKTLVFTIDLDVRSVFIETHLSEDNKSTLYIFTEIPFSRLDIRFPYVMHIFQKEKSRVAIFSAPDLILIRANNAYLDCMQEPFNKRENSIGKRLHTISKGFKGSSYEETWRTLLATGEDYYASEVPCRKHNGDATYWNMSIVPIYEDGVISCFVEITHEVTETVKNREIMQKQKELIMQQKEELEAIIENICDGLSVIDKNGKFIRTNKSVREIMKNKTSIGTTVEQSGDTIKKGQVYLDEYGQELQLQDLPSYKVLRGERVEKQRIVVVNGLNTSFIDFYANPVFDQNGNFKFGVITSHDVTELILKDMAIQQQNETLNAVIENIPEAFFIYDKNGNILQANAEARKKYPDMLTKRYASELLHDLTCFDLDNNPIPFDSLPTSRAFRGERVKNEEIIIRNPDKDQITEVNATPIYDKESNLVSVAVSHHDITDFINSQQQLLQAEKEKNEALESSIRIKDEFLYLITHELKTPLAVISSALQTIDLICQHQLPEKATMLLSTIKNNTNRQLRLVNNLLDITKLRAQQIKLHFGVFDIVALTKAIVNSVLVYGEQKNITVTFSSELAKKTIIVDDEKYERILLNLISNALKFTPEGNSVHVYIQNKQYKKRPMVAIHVKDTGIGIPRNKQQIIFERFGQADTSLSRRSEGTGLGLYLANLFAKALNGEILLKSQEGAGSTFTVLLPAASKKEIAAISTLNKGNDHSLYSDTRILQSAAIEFSDVNN